VSTPDARPGGPPRAAGAEGGVRPGSGGRRQLESVVDMDKLWTRCGMREDCGALVVDMVSLQRAWNRGLSAVK
jgi:hypothetical protein